MYGRLSRFNNSPELQAQALEQWQQNKTGPLTTPGINQVIWLRIPNDSPLLQTYPDPASGRQSPHIELAMTVSTVHLSCVLFCYLLSFEILILITPFDRTAQVSPV